MVVEVTLRQLLDMCIGSPEIGAVNFNYMYSLLHIMIIRLEKLLDASFDAGILDDFSLREAIKIEATRDTFKEGLTQRRSVLAISGGLLPSKESLTKRSDESFLKSSTEPKTTMGSEFTSTSSKSDRKYKDTETDQEKKKLPPSGKSMSSTSTSKKTFSKSSSGRAKESSAPADEDSRGSLGRNVIMSKQSWVAIQRKMKMLEDQVDTLLRTESEDILGHIQRYAPDLSTSQYIEMAQRVTQSKRMDVSEQLINQLSVMLEETSNAVIDLKEQGASDEMKSIVQRVVRNGQATISLYSTTRMQIQLKDIEMSYVTESMFEETIISIQRVLGIDLDRPSPRVRILEGELSETVEGEDGGMKQKITIVTRQTQTLMEIMDSKMDKELYSDITGIPPVILDQIAKVRHGAKFVEKYRLQYELQDKVLVELINKMIDEGVDASEILQMKVQLEDELTARLKEKDMLDDKGVASSVSRRSMSDKSTESDESMGLSTNINKRVNELERDLRDVTRKVEKFSTVGGGGGGAHASSSAEDTGQMEDAKMKFLELYENVEGLGEQINQLVDDGIDKQKQIQKLSDVVGGLKESKADSEEVALLREEKADKMAVESKVDHEIFETALNEFQQEMAALEDKITYVDECHQTTMNTINESLARKADRVDVLPLREYINAKVRMLLIKIKKLASTSGPDDGAATRKQLLKKFHCISCDKPVVVTGSLGFPTTHATAQMPPKQSIGPFTSYEIELVRQQKRISLGKKCLFKSSMDGSRNKRLLSEAARAHVVGCLGPMKDGFPQITEIPETVDTRYCGGSHTLTFPFQRIPQRQGPMFDEVPVIRQEVQIQGTDGNYYKGIPQQSQFKKDEPEERKAAGAEMISGMGNLSAGGLIGGEGTGSGNLSGSGCLGFGGVNLSRMGGTDKSGGIRGVDSPMSCIPLPNMMGGSVGDPHPQVKQTETPSPPVDKDKEKIKEKEDKPPSRTGTPGTLVGVTVGINQLGRRSGSGSSLQSSMRRQFPGTRSQQQSPPPAGSVLSQTTPGRNPPAGMQAKFTTSQTTPTRSPFGVVKSSSGTGIQIRGSGSGTQRLSSTTQLSRTTTPGSSPQLGRGGRPGSRSRDLE